MSNWLDDLGAYYKKQSPPPARVRMILKVFAREPAAVMETAILEHIKLSEYFPSVNELLPHVKNARDVVNSGVFIPPAPIDMSQVERDYLDRQLMVFEVDRGTMRPAEVIDDEVRLARAAVARKLAAAPLVPGANRTAHVRANSPPSGQPGGN